jgi:hypothetical protein
MASDHFSQQSPISQQGAPPHAGSSVVLFKADIASTGSAPSSSTQGGERCCLRMVPQCRCALNRFRCCCSCLNEQEPFLHVK